MGEIVLTNAFISLGGVDVSDHFHSVTIDTGADTQESTAFGDEWRSMEPGLKNWSIAGDYNQDFEAGELDATLEPLLGTKVAIIVRPDAGVVSVPNPQRAGTGILTGYAPLGTSVGELVTGSATFEGDGPLVRTTS